MTGGPRHRRSGWLRSSLSLASALAVWPAAGVAADLFSPIGPVMEGQSAHFRLAALTALVAILPAIILLPIMLWRYRMGGSAKYTPDWEFNKWFESAIWGVPVLVICLMAFWLIQATFKLDPYKPLGNDPLEIDLVGLDFRYLAIYPGQGIASVDEIVIPVDRPVRFRLTTDTVMQSFLPNGFAGQIYAMPGMITKLNLAANREGQGTATQTQFNGAGFANMRIPMRAVSADDFAEWSGGATVRTLDADAYTRLVANPGTAVEFSAAAPELLRLADTCLFDRVVARYHQGTPVEPEAQPGSTLYDPDRAPLPAGSCRTLSGGHPQIDHADPDGTRGSDQERR